MKWLFWVSLSVIGYTYLGYPVWLYLRSRWRPRPVRPGEILPAVTVVIAACNEAENLPRKLRNLAEVDYPADRMEVVVVSDGSTDATNEILSAHANERFKAILLPEHRGKDAALNEGVRAARGEIVVFTDARQWIEPQAIRILVSNFADPSAGCVSGELMMGDPRSEKPLDGVGLYWNVEKKIRQWESDSGSVVGATGAFYAVRRELVVPLPEETILDDVWIPMHVVRQGRRVIFEPRARAWDPLAPSSGQEFRRKVRTLTGNYQLLLLAPWMVAHPHPLRFEFVSHKLLRLLVPFALLSLFTSSWALEGNIYRLAALSQVIFYGSAVLVLAGKRLGPVGRLANLAWTFLVLNTAAVLAFFNFLTRKKHVWAR